MAPFVVPVFLLGLVVPSALGSGASDAAIASEATAVVERVRTADGYEIVLSHRPSPGGPPVILCHGVSSNHRFWDLAPGRSLAEFLQQRGFDVWNLDLRGHGLAERDGAGRRQPAGWTVDDYGRYDLPAAIAFVRTRSRSDDVAYVGHSMGGMVLAVYLASVDKPHLSAVVTAGAPLDFGTADPVVSWLLDLAPWASRIPYLPTPLGARILAWMGDLAPFNVEEMLFNPANVAKEVRAPMFNAIVSPLSSGEIRQFALSGDSGAFRSADGKQTYQDQLGHVTVPMLFLAGGADRVVHPDQVRRYYDAVGAAEREFVVVSLANGFSADYGHLDFGIADRAVTDIFPRIERWFREHP